MDTPDNFNLETLKLVFESKKQDYPEVYAKLMKSFEKYALIEDEDDISVKRFLKFFSDDEETEGATTAKKKSGATTAKKKKWFCIARIRTPSKIMCFISQLFAE